MVNLHIIMSASKPVNEKVYFIFESFCRVWTSEESKLLKFTIETNFWDCLDGNHYKYPLPNWPLMNKQRQSNMTGRGFHDYDLTYIAPLWDFETNKRWHYYDLKVEVRLEKHSYHFLLVGPSDTIYWCLSLIVLFGNTKRWSGQSRHQTKLYIFCQLKIYVWQESWWKTEKAMKEIEDFGSLFKGFAICNHYFFGEFGHLKNPNSIFTFC